MENIRSGGCGEIRLLWDQFEPGELSEWAAWSVNGDGGGQRQCLGRNDVVYVFAGSFRGRFLSRALPYHCAHFSALQFGLFSNSTYEI